MIGKKLQQPQGCFALTNGRIILPQAVASAQALVVEEGKIAGITDIDSLGGEIERIDVGGRYIAPGLIDIHNHGALGHTFNDPTEQAFATITEENVRRRCDIFAGDDSHGIDCRSAGQSRVQPAMDARPSRWITDSGYACGRALLYRVAKWRTRRCAFPKPG